MKKLRLVLLTTLVASVVFAGGVSAAKVSEGDTPGGADYDYNGTLTDGSGEERTIPQK